VFLVWAEDPSQDCGLCEELKQFATRIIFDSECTEDLGNFSQIVLQMQKKFSCEVADLNWARLENWRSLLSSIFSHPEKLKHLQNARVISITYNAQETPFFCHTKIQSIYLQAWIACRLKWSLQSFSSTLASFIYQNGEKKIEVKLQEVKKSQLPPGVILSLNIQTEAGENLVFSRDANNLAQVSLEYSSQTQCQLPIQMLIAKSDSGQSLVKEICHKGTSEHYLAVLKLLASGNLLC
jgi:glucose-6-phosphate dehydrogenase assembly protein OpcA